MSSENSVFLEQEKTSTALLNDILDQLKHIPNTTVVVNSINHLNAICVPMIGANKLAQQANGVSGFVPAPSITEANKFLRGDGTWQPVITSIDPLKTESLVYPTNIINATGYPYVQPSDDTSGTVGTLKYNTNLRFGRHEVTIGSARYAYTLLGIKQDNISTDAGIEFINSSSSGGSTILFANLSNSNIKVKMPTTSGMLLTDNGFTALKKSTFADGITVYNLATFVNGANVTGDLIVKPTSSRTPTIKLGEWTIQSTSHKYIELTSKPTDADVITSHLVLRNAEWVTHHPIRSSKFILNAFDSDSSTGNKSDRYVISTDNAGNISNVTGVSGAAVAFNNGIGLVNLLHGANSSFYVNSLNIEPRYDGSSSLEGGEIHLSARQRSDGSNESYGTIWIDNYNGTCRIGKIGNNAYMIIDPTNATITATGFRVTTNSIAIGFANVINRDNTHVDFSQPVSCSVQTPVGDGNRYYRPTYISQNAPTSNSGADGDVWIQYS